MTCRMSASEKVGSVHTFLLLPRIAFLWHVVLFDLIVVPFVNVSLD